MDKNLYEFSERVHYTKPDSETDRPVLAVISGSKYSLMVDAGASPDHASNFINRILEHKLAYPSFSVLTHWHWDHSFGAVSLECPIIAHELAEKELVAQREFTWDTPSINNRVETGLEIPMIRDHLIVEYPNENREIEIRIPDLLINDCLKIDLGGLHCIIKSVGGDHSLDSLVIYIPEEKLLFLGDCTFYNLQTKLPVYTPERVLPLFEYLLSLDVEYYFFSHDEYPTARASFIEYADIIMNLAKAFEMAKEENTLVALKAAYSKLVDARIPDDYIELAEAFLRR